MLSAANVYPKQRPLKRHISALGCVVEVSAGFFLSSEKSPAGNFVRSEKVGVGVTYVSYSCDTDAAWDLASRGFNGQLRMDEVGAGRGNWYTATYWEYNAPLGRRMNVDPVDQIGISNYSVNRLNPIVYSDPLGNDPIGSRKNGHDAGMPGSGTTADLPEVEVGSSKTGRTRTAAGLDEAIDGYVARKSAMDNTTAAERTGNKYEYAAYHMQRDVARRESDANWVHDRWEASYAQTSSDMARFGLIMVGAGATIAVSAPIIAAGGATLATEKFAAGAIGNLAGQVFTGDNKGKYGTFGNVNWMAVIYAGAANPWAAEMTGSTFKFTINSGFDESLVSGNDAKRMSNGAWLLNVGVTGVVGSVNSSSVDMSGIWKYSGLKTTLGLFGSKGGRIVRIGYGTTINTMFNSGANAIENEAIKH